MNYTLHSMHWEGDTLVNEVIDDEPTANLALLCSFADYHQVIANRNKIAKAFQVRDEEGKLVYWTSCKQPSTRWKVPV
jgi:hypothetical protein